MRTPLTLMIRVIGFAAAFAYVILALAPNGATRIYQWPWSGLVSLVALAPIVLLFLLGLRRKVPLDPTTGLAIALLAITIVLSALVSRFSTQSLDVSLIGLGMLATIPCLAAVAQSDPGGMLIRLQKGIGWFGLVFALFSLYGWTMRILPWEARHVHAINWNAGETLIEWNAFNYRNTFPLGHANYTAGLMLLLLPWVIGLAVRERRGKRIAWLAVAGLVGFVLFSAGSRGALLGVVAVTAGLLTWLTIRGTIKLKFLIPLGLIGVVGLALFAFSQPRVRHLIEDFNESGELNAGDIQRWSMLDAGLRMGLDHPFLGQGPGVTPLTYPSYRGRLDGGVESALQLHSTPLQIWADLGIIGLALTLILGALIARRLWRYARSPSPTKPASPKGIAVASAALSTIGYLAFSLTDFQLDVPVFAGFLGINLGIILGVTRPPENAALPSRWFRPARLLVATVAALALLPVLWSVGHETLARRSHSAAVDQLERGNPGGFEAGIAAARRWSPTNAFYPASGALGMLRLSYQTTDPASVARLEAATVRLFQESLSINADQEIAHFNLGWLLLESDPRSAETHFRQAAALVPDKGGVYMGRGLACFEQEDKDGTVIGFALEIVNDPKFALAPFWDIPVFRPYRQPSIQAAIAMLRSDAVVGSHPRAMAPSEVANLVEELLNSHSPTPLMISRSGPASALAAMPSEARRRAIELLIIRRQGGLGAEDAVAPLLALFERHGSDLKGILNDPVGREQPMMHQVRRERSGYGILMRNLDVPLPLDAYIVQENGIVRDLFPALFPAKGYLPAPVLVALAEAGRSGGRIP